MQHIDEGFLLYANGNTSVDRGWFLEVPFLLRYWLSWVGLSSCFLQFYQLGPNGASYNDDRDVNEWPLALLKQLWNYIKWNIAWTRPVGSCWHQTVNLSFWMVLLSWGSCNMTLMAPTTKAVPTESHASLQNLSVINVLTKAIGQGGTTELLDMDWHLQPCG